MPIARIEALTESSDSCFFDSARALFRGYLVFLRATEGHTNFDYGRFEEEIRTLPITYTGANGEVLLAIKEEECVGCIAYREFPSGEEPNCCEIKRFFVDPSHRGGGLGEQLVRGVLERARGRGYETACLDTEPAGMGAAHHIYLKLGFTEYTRQIDETGACLCFLRKPLI